MPIEQGLAALRPREIARALHRRLVAIFVIASLTAVAAGLVFFAAGLDFSPHQRRVVFWAIAPTAMVPMVAAELLAIRWQVRPIRTFLEALADQEDAARPLAGAALVRALNMPLLAAIRVFTVHAPAFIVPTTLLALLANEYLYLDLEGWQFLLMWVTTAIFTAGHAIYEYFAVAAAVKPIVPLTRRYAGALSPAMASRIIPLNTKRKLLLVFFFVAIVPLFTLGATTLLKFHRVLWLHKVEDLMRVMAPLEAWTAMLIAASLGVTLVMAALLAREIASETGALAKAMKRVESGQLDVRLDVTTTDEFADLYDGFNRMTAGLLERERLRDAFGRYVAPEIAEEVMRTGVHMGGSTVKASVLFADIRGFTALSEQMKPSEIVGLLNRYFAAVEPAIREEGGFINKFGGDSLLAVFGAPVPRTDHAARAVRSALGMRAALAAFNAREGAEGRPPLRIGIGVSSGEMVAGSVGTPDRMEYTVIGDVVNVASRIQALNKEWGTDILVSADSMDQVEGGVAGVPMPAALVQGKSAPLQVFAI